MYSPLNARSFLTSKNAGDGFTSSIRNSATISSHGRISRSPPRGPAEQHQVVAHGRGEIALVAECLQRDLVPALGQLLPLLVDHDRQVPPSGRLMPECFPEQLLLRRIRQMLLAADHVRNPLHHVIDDIAQQEQDRPVGSGQHEILDGRVLEHGLAAYQVVHDGRTLVGRTEPQRPARARPEAAVPAVAVVAPVLVTGPGDDVLAGAVAVVSAPLLVELLRRGCVLGQVGRLEVRSLVLAGVDAEPGESADDAIDPLGLVARRVGVLDPQHHRAAGLQRQCPVEQDRPRAADMEHAGRRRRKAQPDVRIPASHGSRV